MHLLILLLLAASILLNVFFLQGRLTKQSIDADKAILRSRLGEIRSVLGLAANTVHTDVLAAIKKLQGKA